MLFRACPVCFLVGVITRSCTHLKVSISGSVRHNLYLPISAIALRVGAFVSNAVLMADILRHFTADLIHFIQVPGEDSNPAGLEGESFKGPFCTPLLPFI